MVPYVLQSNSKVRSSLLSVFRFSQNLKLDPIPTVSKSQQHTMVGPSHSTLKFLCSYGGKILPRYPDGKLRYLGGHTRVLTLPRSIHFSELLVKLGELCGSPVTHLRCQLPTEDLDALVSITSDEDLANLIEEYDRVSSLKIRAFLSSSTLSKSSSSFSSSTLSSRIPTGGGGGSSPRYTAMPPVADCCVHQMSPAIDIKQSAGTGRNVHLPYYVYHHVQGNRGVVYLIHNGNHWH